MSKKYVSLVVVLVALVNIVAIASPVLADTNTLLRENPSWQNQNHGQRPGMMRMRPSVIGTVSAISGDSITISGQQGFSSSTAAVVFTIDATNAQVTKNNATSSISDIAVGDRIAVQGTVTGTNVIATFIYDGLGMYNAPKGRMPNMGRRGNSSSSTQILGNGQPVIAGKVLTINGGTLIINNKSNIQYTVDTSNAKFVEGQNTISLSNITVGDMVVVQGVMNGTAVTASTVIDQKGFTNMASSSAAYQSHPGFLSAIGHFFTHLFGF